MIILSKLLEWVNTPLPVIDQRLKNKLFVNANTLINSKVNNLFSRAVVAVSDQLENDDKLDKLPFKATCIFTDYGKVAIELLEGESAIVMGLIIYPIQKWIDQKYTDLQILICITEELCHYFWSIEDEVEVNYKVLEVIQRIRPESNIQMKDLYNIEWMEANKKDI